METGTVKVVSFGGKSISSVMKKMSKWLKLTEEDVFVWDVVVDVDCDEDNGLFYGRIMYNGDWDADTPVNDVDEFDEEEWQAEEDKNRDDDKCFTCDERFDCLYYAKLLKEVKEEEYPCDKCEFVDECKERWRKGRCVDTR